MYSTSDEFNEVYDMFCPEDNYKEKKVVQQEDNLDALLRELIYKKERTTL
jgi:hypothetical protein